MEHVQNAAVRPRVVVIGAGFGGIHAALGLGKLPLDVTVVDKKNHHTFSAPALSGCARAVLSPGDIAQPIRSILRNNSNTEVIMDEGDGFRHRREARQSQERHRAYHMTSSSSRRARHTATSAKTNGPSLPPACKTVEDATEIRKRAFCLLLNWPSARSSRPARTRPLNFVIIGGGPTGVELAGAISDIAHLYTEAGLPAHRSFPFGKGSHSRGLAVHPRGLSSGPSSESDRAAIRARCHDADRLSRHRYPGGLCNGR